MCGDHLLDLAGLRIQNHQLCRVAERGVDHRILHAVVHGVGPVHPVPTLVVDADLTTVGKCNPAGVGHRAGSHQGPAAAGRLSGTQFTGRVNDHLDPGGVDTQFLDCDLNGHGVDPLTHLGPAVANLYDPILSKADHGTGHLVEAVAEARVLEAQPQAHGPTGSLGCVIGLPHLVEACPRSEGTVVHHLTRSPHDPGANDVAATHLPAGDSHLFCETVHHSLHGELCLVGSEAAECPTHRVVGAYGGGLHVDFRHRVRAACMPGSALQDLHSHRGIGA